MVIKARWTRLYNSARKLGADWELTLAVGGDLVQEIEEGTLNSC